MPTIEPLKKLDIDGQKVLVEDMSPEVQQLVAIYNEWAQDATDARTRFAQLQAATQMAHTQLNNQIQKEFQEARTEAAADEQTENPGPSEDPAPVAE